MERRAIGGERLAPLAARLRHLEEFVRPLELVPILLEQEAEAIAEYGIAGLQELCWQKGLVVNVRGEILGFQCLCGAGEHQHGVGCTIKRSECTIARNWDRRVARAEARYERERAKWEQEYEKEERRRVARLEALVPA